MKWVLQKTTKKSKAMNHVALQGDPIDEEAAVIFNSLPLFVKIMRLDEGEYIFGRLHIFAEYGDPDGDGDEDLMACICEDDEEDAPPLKVEMENMDEETKLEKPMVWVYDPRWKCLD